MNHSTPLSCLATKLNIDFAKLPRDETIDRVCSLALDLLEDQQTVPNEQGTNEYGLDVAYFRKTINRELNRPLDRHKPDELARVLARLARTADKDVLHEPEFAGAPGAANNQQPPKPRPIPMMKPMVKNRSITLCGPSLPKSFGGIWEIRERSNFDQKGGGEAKVVRVMTSDPEKEPVGESFKLHYEMVCSSFSELSIHPKEQANA